MRTKRGRISGGLARQVGASDGTAGYLLDFKRGREAGRLQPGSKPADARKGQAKFAGEVRLGDGVLLEPFVQVHDSFLHRTQESRKCILTLRGVVRQIPPRYNATMARKSDIANAPNAISLWRQIRGLTIEDVADASGLSGAQINRIERGDAYTMTSLEAIATMLKVQSWMLLLVPRGSRTLLRLVEEVDISTDAERARLLAVIQLLRSDPAA